MRVITVVEMRASDLSIDVRVSFVRARLRREMRERHIKYIITRKTLEIETERFSGAVRTARINPLQT